MENNLIVKESSSNNIRNNKELLLLQQTWWEIKKKKDLCRTEYAASIHELNDWLVLVVYENMGFSYRKIQDQSLSTVNVFVLLHMPNYRLTRRNISTVGVSWKKVKRRSIKAKCAISPWSHLTVGLSHAGGWMKIVGEGRRSVIGSFEWNSSE